MIVCGIDEAGRGSAIGPMVVAGVSFSEDKLERLIELGVRDSKSLSRSRREALYEEIKKMADGIVEVVVSPSEIDASLRRKGGPGINFLEMKVMAKIIKSLSPDVVYIDSPDVDAQRYRERLLSILDFKPRVFCEHKADARHAVVAAASIVAKVRRDSEVGKIREAFGDVGSGYSSDRRTRDFIRAYILESGCLPSFVRKGWKTVGKVLQTNLDSYAGPEK